MLWAAFTLAFFGFLRSSEFTCNGPFNPSVHLTSNDVTLVPNSHSPSHMLVCIKQSKTDPFRQGHTITIAKSSSPICSVIAMKDYLLHAQPPSSHPLFAFIQPRQWFTWNNLTTELRTIMFFNTVVSLQTISTPTVSALELPQQQPKLAFHPGSLKF